MPVATIDINDVQKYDLKSCPGGFVTIRRMPYGQWLHRSEIAMNMKIRGDRRQQFEGEIDMANKAVTTFEFSECIVDHNLTMPDDSPLDFRQPHTLSLLDPRIGNEIARYISDLHEFEADLGNV